MKQVQARALRERSDLVNSRPAPCAQGKTQKSNSLNSTKHIFKKRGRPSHKRSNFSPKLALQQSTSASSSDLQTHSLTILQSQQSQIQIQVSRPIQFPQLSSCYNGASQQSCDGEAGDVSVYLPSINDHLFQQQSRFPPPLFLYTGCFDQNARISNLNLIFYFAKRHGFKVETIFLSFSIYHRVAFTAQFARCLPSLQAITSLFIAAKYEEIIIPKSEVFATCDPRIDDDHILRLQSQILLHFNFNLSFPNVLHFIDLFRLRYKITRTSREKLISICYASLNSLALWQEKGSLMALACLHMLYPQLQVGQSQNEQLNAQLKWRVAELVRVGVTPEVLRK